MAENSSTKTVRTLLVRQGSHVQRFEDKLTPGIPDMGATMKCGRYAFLEGKFLKALPMRDSSLIRFGGKDEPRLAHQRNWLKAHYYAGGLAFWWVRVRDGRWHLFSDRFDWLVTGVTKHEFMTTRSFASAKEMVACLNKEVEDHGR